MVAIIVANTIALAAAYPYMSATYSNTLNYLNMAFTFLFLFEMIVKVCTVHNSDYNPRHNTILQMVAFELKGYFSSYWNVFDFFVVAVSILEIILVYANINAGSGLSVLRSFRLLRVFKLATAWFVLLMIFGWFLIA